MFARLLTIPLFTLILTGCGAGVAPSLAFPPAQRAGSCTLSLEENAGDEDAIRAVISAEGELVVAQEVTPLMQLWAEDGFVADAKYTPNEEADDQRWIGSDAIRHRYVRTVFPGGPSTVQPADLEIVIDDASAIVRATTHIGDEVAPSGDRWELIKSDGCWYLKSLTYNLEQPN